LFKGIRAILADQFRCEFIRNVPRFCNLLAHEVC
jgi:hypothetical protein